MLASRNSIESTVSSFLFLPMTERASALVCNFRFQALRDISDAASKAATSFPKNVGNCVSSVYGLQ